MCWTRPPSHRLRLLCCARIHLPGESKRRGGRCCAKVCKRILQRRGVCAPSVSSIWVFRPPMLWAAQQLSPMPVSRQNKWEFLDCQPNCCELDTNRHRDASLLIMITDKGALTVPQDDRQRCGSACGAARFHGPGRIGVSAEQDGHGQHHTKLCPRHYCCRAFARSQRADRRAARRFILVTPLHSKSCDDSQVTQTCQPKKIIDIGQPSCCHRA